MHHKRESPSPNRRGIGGVAFGTIWRLLNPLGLAKVITATDQMISAEVETPGPSGDPESLRIKGQILQRGSLGVQIADSSAAFRAALHGPCAFGNKIIQDFIY